MQHISPADWSLLHAELVWLNWLVLEGESLVPISVLNFCDLYPSFIVRKIDITSYREWCLRLKVCYALENQNFLRLQFGLYQFSAFFLLHNFCIKNPTGFEHEGEDNVINSKQKLTCCHKWEIRQENWMRNTGNNITNLRDKCVGGEVWQMQTQRGIFEVMMDRNVYQTYVNGWWSVDTLSMWFGFNYERFCSLLVTDLI